MRECQGLQPRAGRCCAHPGSSETARHDCRSACTRIWTRDPRSPGSGIGPRWSMRSPSPAGHLLDQTSRRTIARIPRDEGNQDLAARSSL